MKCNKNILHAVITGGLICFLSAACATKNTALKAESKPAGAVATDAAKKNDESVRDQVRKSKAESNRANKIAKQADDHMAQNDFMQAKILYERVLSEKKFKEPARVYNDLAVCEWNLKNYSAAVNAWEKAIKTNSSFMPPYHHLAGAALRSGDYIRAEELYRKVVSANSKDLPSSILLAVALRGKGDFVGAEKVYLNVLQIDGSQPEALFDLAILYHKFLGRPQTAVLYYERFAAAKPELAKSKKFQDLIAKARTEASVKTAAKVGAKEKEKDL